MARILIVDDEQRRHDRFRAILCANPSVNGESRIADFGKNGIVQYRWVANHVEPHVVDSAYDLTDAQELLKSRVYDLACLDHDLGHKTRDGRLLCRWLQYCPRLCPRKVLIHSRNLVAADEMAALLNEMTDRRPMIKLLPFKPSPDPEENQKDKYDEQQRRDLCKVGGGCC